MIKTLVRLRRELRTLGDPERARLLQSFFKTGPGEYGEGDQFLGVTVPATRRFAKASRDLPLRDVHILLRSPIHEERFLAVVMLVDRYERGDAATREEIYRLYLRNTRFINNWDLVDTSAYNIVGRHLRERSRAKLYAFVRSRNLWERRIAIVATLEFIAHGEFADTIAIAKLLLRDPHDLMHKAVGWMLREVGKRDAFVLHAFLRRHAAHMPRTMLRYAIERFPERTRGQYLALKRALT